MSFEPGPFLGRASERSHSARESVPEAALALRLSRPLAERAGVPVGVSLGEEIWFRLRTNRFLRTLYGMRPFRSLLRRVSFRLSPGHRRKCVSVRSGPGRGLLMELNPRWQRDLWDGSYERPVQETILEHVRPGAVFYDVGAGPGFFAMIAARLGASVIAFEPDERNLEILTRHLEMNGLAHAVRVVRRAVFSHTGKVGLFPADQRRGPGNARVASESEAPLAVECITLDDFVSSEGMLPTFIKVDVEGAESAVLSGAQTCLARARPLLVCEVHDADNAELARALLERQGYTVGWLERRDSFPLHFFARPPAAGV